MWELIPLGIISNGLVSCLFDSEKKAIVRRIFKVKKYILTIAVIPVGLVATSFGLSFFDQKEVLEWLFIIVSSMLIGFIVSFASWAHVYSLRMGRCIKVFVKAMKKKGGKTYYYKTIPYRIDAENGYLILDDCKAKIKGSAKDKQFDKAFGEEYIKVDIKMEARRIDNMIKCWTNSNILRTLNNRRKEQINYIKEKKDLFCEKRKQYLENDNNVN